MIVNGFLDIYDILGDSPPSNAASFLEVVYFDLMESKGCWCVLVRFWMLSEVRQCCNELSERRGFVVLMTLAESFNSSPFSEESVAELYTY